MSDFKVRIASIPTREYVVAEIFYNHEQWVEISQEMGEFVIRFYSPDEGDYWEFSCDEALEVLEKAKKRLKGEG